MAITAESKSKFNLKNAAVLLVESGAMDMDILVHIIVGFGCKNIRRAENIEAAKLEINRSPLDLIIVDAVLREEDGCDLVKWLRNEASPPNRYAPLMMISAHTPLSKVNKARDCGAHFVIAKPLTPIVILERILWLSREGRAFVNSEAYVGPDRRFKFAGLPDGETGRRSDDLSGDLGDAVAPNMDQSQIDALMQPLKVQI